MTLMRLSEGLRGSISVTAGRAEDEYDLLEKSFLRHFPADSKYLMLLKSMKKSSDIQ
jgi:hypothetical protein